MASRRLDISSLLCDVPPTRLDALVNAASEERRRLSGPLLDPDRIILGQSNDEEYHRRVVRDIDYQREPGLQSPSVSSSAEPRQHQRRTSTGDEPHHYADHMTRQHTDGVARQQLYRDQLESPTYEQTTYSLIQQVPLITPHPPNYRSSSHDHLMGSPDVRLPLPQALAHIDGSPTSPYPPISLSLPLPHPPRRSSQSHSHSPQIQAHSFPLTHRPASSHSPHTQTQAQSPFSRPSDPWGVQPLSKKRRHSGPESQPGYEPWGDAPRRRSGSSEWKHVLEQPREQRRSSEERGDTPRQSVGHSHDDKSMVTASLRNPIENPRKSRKMESDIMDLKSLLLLKPISVEVNTDRPQSIKVIIPEQMVSPILEVLPRTPRAADTAVEQLKGKQRSQDDAHEWLLEHYTDPVSVQDVKVDLPPAISAPPTLTNSAFSRPQTHPSSQTTAAMIQKGSEEELVEIVAPGLTNGADVDMAVDLAVAELVDEALDASAAKTLNDPNIEVDVEDELLSLVDSHSARHPPSSSASAYGLAPAQNRSTATSKSALDRRVQIVGKGSRPTSPATFLPTVRASSSRPTLTPDRDHESMPPPSLIKDTGAVTLSAGNKKKKKESGVQKVPPKPRAKPGPKSKAKDSGTVSGKSSKAPPLSATKKSTSANASRSRSASVMPGGSDGDPKIDKEGDEEEMEEDDDKLYCVCKTRYDEDRVMIACDRCDEWYHTQCVDMPDLEVDLVDQFICPLCIGKNPQLSLQTTYKRRCLNGLQHADPASSKACHKPARGAFSKYCSDECGVKYMQMRIDTWTKKGGKKDKLWETVKGAEKREGVAIRADADASVENARVKKSKVAREVERLDALLDGVVKVREEIKKGMEVVLWRERLLELACERAENVGQCGWDQRLCFGDDEWIDFGVGVLESYEDGAETVKQNGDDAMQVDGEGEWWCPGQKICDRHAGWQSVRYKDVSKEKEKKEEALLKLTTREREIRKRIEDLVDPHGTNCNETPTKAPLGASNKLTNGHTKTKTNGEPKKGKKRKAPA